MQKSLAGGTGSLTDDSPPAAEGKSCPLATGQAFLERESYRVGKACRALNTCIKVCVEGLVKCLLQHSEQ